MNFTMNASPGPNAGVPLAGNVMSVILSLVTFGVLCVCLTRRLQSIQKFSALPLASWLILAIYIDSTLFVFFTAIVARGVGINTSRQICEGAIILCLVCYLTTKVLIYFFLVERAYIIRGSQLPRFKTKLWLFNFFAMIVPYFVVIVVNFVWRIAYISDKGECIIGMEKVSMLPLIIFDVLVNVYLTILFIIPLRQLYSYRNNINPALRKMAFRTFIGTLATLTSSVANLTILMVLRGEPGWICLMCCNADLLFSVLVLHWVTQIDSSHRTSANTGSRSRRTSAAPAAIDLDNHDGDARAPKPRFWARGKRSDVERKKPKATSTTLTQCYAGEIPGKDNKVERVEDTQEAHQITVRTEHTREVEIESNSSTQDLGSYPASKNSDRTV